jgi:2-polyprenyl-3-methyl-5-hydroxy-6-metoxy-1,4-benzoquinol methylase
MPKSNTLRVVGQVLSNPKNFAREWRLAQQDLAQTKQELNLSQQRAAQFQQQLSEATAQFHQKLAEASRRMDSLSQQLETARSNKRDRTRDVKAAYERHVTQVLSQYPEEEAMSLAVGGQFEEIGNIEVALLQYCWLRSDSYLIDVGCGSGRLAKPLASYLTTGHYSGYDVVGDLVEHARKISGRPDWRFDVVDHIEIPEPGGCADMVCFFSVLTHLMHERIGTFRKHYEF